MLRLLQNEYPVRCVIVQEYTHPVDTIADLKKVNKLLKKKIVKNN